MCCRGPGFDRSVWGAAVCFAVVAEPMHHQDISKVELLTVRVVKELLEKKPLFFGQGGEDTEKAQARVAKNWSAGE